MILNGKIKGISKRTAVLAVALAGFMASVQGAVAAPVMLVVYSGQVADFDPVTPDLERRNNYEVTNVSSQNLPENYLIEFVIPAGANQGVYHAEESTGSWGIQIFANRTVFSGNGEFIDPGFDTVIFSIYVPETQPLGTGLVEATAEGNGSPLPFNSVELKAPIAFPPTYVPLSVVGNAFGFNTVAGKTYHVFHTTDLVGVPWSTEIFVSGNGTTVYVSFDLSQDAGFYKVEEL